MSSKRLPVVPRPKAEEDTDEFFFHLADARKRPETPNEFLDELYKAYEQLSENPALGHPYPVPNPRLEGLRVWPVPRFSDRLIYYIATETRIDVVRILGAPQNRDRILVSE